MTRLPVPAVDSRTAAMIARQTRQLLRDHYLADLPAGAKTLLGDPDKDPLGGPIVPIFAHFAELVIDRLNRAPEKNFFAFINLLGASLLAPQPARVELTFSLLPDVKVAFVSAGTQVAAALMPGETEPVIFETEEDLTIQDQGSPEGTPKCTVWAAQYVTYLGEILGSGNGTESQTVRIQRAPVLPGQSLEVREPDLPPATEREAIEKEEGNAVRAVADATGRTKEIWVRWHEVPDFYASGPRDRHYVIDRLNGVIHFGDGVNGLIPAPGSGNFVMTEYRVSGGTAGNRAAGTITQLRTAIGGVGGVTNAEAAQGGVDPETPERLLDRAPRAIRHRGRAVTKEDFEDLAVEASPDVARAKCLPLFDLSAAVGDPRTNKPGVLSVIIVPRSSDARPMPDDQLLQRVRDVLTERCIPSAEVRVCAPIYMRVSVITQVVVAPGDAVQKVRDGVGEALRRFLHPLTGGPNGLGWEFGRKPYRSDLYALLEGITGVDHVSKLKIDSDAPEIDAFLVRSGEHTVEILENRG